MAPNAKWDPISPFEENVPISMVILEISVSITKGLQKGLIEVASGSLGITWPSASSCQPGLSLEDMGPSLTESLGALTRTELKMITSGTYHAPRKWCSIKEKIIWGHTTQNEHLTLSHWSGFRKLL